MNVFRFAGMSPIRKRYMLRLVGRVCILIAGVVLCFTAPEQFEVLNGFRFFETFSLLHLLWGIWILDMVSQLLPIHKHISIGSQKVFRQFFKPIKERVNKEALKRYILSTTRSAFWVLLLWAALIALIGLCYWLGWIGKTALFMISVLFYVCDLICVLVWCPFRLIMHNRCCTTCRIFNWDHMMMFSPLLFMGGFYAVSLLAVAALVWLMWEGCVLVYPERFWEQTNASLQCAQCTDKLCTQYCRKLRSK